MGESACLLQQQQQPFCYASGIPNEASESNLIHAFGQSISFGRFRQESLAWEKWSSFTHNRYVEEAERSSRPGSVAEKKAFFEAHYKKLAAQKAAALLEQENNSSSNYVTDQEHDHTAHCTPDSQTTSPTSDVSHNEEQVKGVIFEPDAILGNSSSGSHSNSNIVNINRVGGCQPPATNSMKVKSQSQLLEDVHTPKEASEKHSGKHEDEVLVLQPIITKTLPPASFLKSFKSLETSKFNLTPAKPISHKKESALGTPMSSKKLALSSVDKQRSTVNSTPIRSVDKYISTVSSTPIRSVDKRRSTVNSTPIRSVDKKISTVNSTPIRELNRFTVSVMRKLEGARIGNASSKASKDSSTPSRTPATASKNQLQKPPALTPLTEKRRTKTPVASSASGNNTAGPKWRLPSIENKVRSPIITSPFGLRTEERAARRKKKLEEKFNADEAQKLKLHTTLKEKVETEIRRLRQTFCFKARPLPDFYEGRKELKSETNKCLLTQLESPKQGKKPSPCRLWGKSSVTPQKSTMKNNGYKNHLETNGQISNNFLTPNSRMIAQENTTPNIQHGNQNASNHRESKQRLEQGIARRCRRAWHIT